MKPHYHYSKTWRMSYWYFIGWKPEVVAAWLKDKFNVKLGFGGCDGKTFRLNMDDNVVLCIWTARKGDIGVIAHEALHACNITLSMRGVVADFDNDEAQAYLMTEILEGYYNRGKKC